MAGIVRRSAGFTLFLWMVLVFLLIQRERAGVPAPVFYVNDPHSALPVYQWLLGLHTGIPWFVITGLTFLFAFIDGFLLMRMMVRNMVIQERSYLPVLIFLIAAFGTVCGGFSLIGTLIAFLLILSIDTMLDSFRREMLLGKVFNSAFLAGTAVIIYPSAVIYLPILFCAMIIFRKTWREWVVCFIGFPLPFLMCSYIFWMTGGEINAIWEILVSEVTVRLRGELLPAVADPYQIALWGSALLLTIASIAEFARGYSTTRTRPYKTFVYFMWILFFSAILFVVPGRSPMDLFLLAVPISVMISAYLIRNKSTFATVLYLLFLLSALVNIVAPLFLD